MLEGHFKQQKYQPKEQKVNNMALKRPQKKHLFTVEKPKQEGSVALFDLSWEHALGNSGFLPLCACL